MERAQAGPGGVRGWERDRESKREKLNLDESSTILKFFFFFFLMGIRFAQVPCK